MVDQSNLDNNESIPSSTTGRVFYPFQTIFHGIQNMTDSLFKPSTLQLSENDQLRAQLKSRKEELKANIERNEGLEELNSTLTATVTTLELDSDRMLDSLASMEQTISTGNEKIDELTECLERLKYELRNTKQKNKELDEQMKKGQLLMDTRAAEWNCKIDDLRQKNLSFETKLRTKDGTVLKQMQYIANAEADLGQINAIGNLVRSKVQTLKKDYQQMEDENSELRVSIENLESEVHNLPEFAI